MDGTAQWPQGIGVVKAVENSTSYANNNPSIEKKPRPQKDRALHCPRCRSTNTKFCYYNNYSLSQPRYFCKNCRRYWTEGGTLRNVPIGGGSRKNRRSSSSSLNSSKRSIIIDNNIASSNYKLLQNPNKVREWPDPEFAYHDQLNHGMSEQFIALPSFTVLDVSNTNHQNVVKSSSDTSRIPVMELLRTGNFVSGGLSSSLLPLQVHNSNPSLYSSAGFPLHDQIKPSFNFSLDQNGYGNLQLGFEDLADASRNVPLFPFEELKTVSDSDNQLAQDRGEGGRGHSNGFKSNGMLAHRSW